MFSRAYSWPVHHAGLFLIVVVVIVDVVSFYFGSACHYIALVFVQLPRYLYTFRRCLLFLLLSVVYWWFSFGAIGAFLPVWFMFDAFGRVCGVYVLSLALLRRLILLWPASPAEVWASFCSHGSVGASNVSCYCSMKQASVGVSWHGSSPRWRYLLLYSGGVTGSCERDLCSAEMIVCIMVFLLVVVDTYLLLTLSAQVDSNRLHLRLFFNASGI